MSCGFLLEGNRCLCVLFFLHFPRLSWAPRPALSALLTLLFVDMPILFRHEVTRARAGDGPDASAGLRGVIAVLRDELALLLPSPPPSSAAAAVVPLTAATAASTEEVNLVTQLQGVRDRRRAVVSDAAKSRCAAIIRAVSRSLCVADVDRRTDFVKFAMGKRP